jgi:outer membrane protein OmpA-like peptidoglycan-associated protein
MKLNRISIIFCLLGLTMPTFGSNIAGNTEFLKRNYEGAIEQYKETLSNTDSTKSKSETFALYRIGECYSYLNEPEEAVNYLNNAITSGYQEADAYLIYGKNLQKLGKYTLAKAAFEEVERLQPANPLVKNLKASCDFAIRFSSQNPISPEEYISGINTTDLEYGIGFYKSGIIYSKTSKDKDEYRSQMYFADNSDEFSSSRSVDNMIKTGNKPNIGTFAVDTLNNIMYYTKCINNENNDCFIYYSVFKKDKWKNKGVLPIGDRHTDAAHPALSANGKRLYFTSNRAGGYGGSDIWYIEKKQNGKWDYKPINAGAVVNTAGNEAFPYVVGNTLIFASDGGVGFGGYDLYSAIIDGKSISGVQNLYRPINSSFDDINIIVSEKNDEAFLISNRKTDTKDDVYRFKGIFSATMISGHVYDKKTGLPLSEAQVILNGMGKSQTVQTNEDGYYYAFVEAGDFYKLIASSMGYLSDIAMAKTEKTSIGSFPVEQDFYLSQAAMSISGRVYDMETNEPFINEDVMLLQDGKVVQQTKTDITGRYTFTDLENGKEYQVKVNKPNFLSISSRPFRYSEGDSNNSQFDLASIPSAANAYSSDDKRYNKEGAVVGWGREIFLYDIYYNFDSAKLLPESKHALDKIILLLQSNPTLKLEFGSHTDSRGTHEYNDKLSNERAKSVVDYLVSAGIDSTRLSWKGYGKRHPLIANPATEGEHRMNRRTSFKIVEN